MTTTNRPNKNSPEKEKMQFIFDIMVKHMFTQKAKSERSEPTGNTCLYRGPNGTKCPVGALIVDEHYTEHLECKSSDQPEVQRALLASQDFLIEEELPHPSDKRPVPQLQILLNKAQLIHDTDLVETWELRLRQIASHFDLGFNPPEAKI